MRQSIAPVLALFLAALLASCASTRDSLETASATREAGPLLIRVSENGDLAVDGQPVDVRNLRAFIERVRLERPGDSALIVTDANPSTRLVVEVMDQVRLGGVAEIAFAADSGTAGS